MWKYIRKYLLFAIIAGMFMIGEVMMDLVQPGFMSRIVDDGVFGVNNGGRADLHLIWMLGLQMIGLVLVGGLCGSLNNVFVHISSQNIGNEIRKDCFGRIMDFSFPQMDRFGTGSLVTRVTNDITQVQNFVSLFVRGLIRTSLLTFGSMYFMFRLNFGFGLIVLCAFPFLVGVIGLCLWRANPLFSRLQAHLDAINEIMQEDVSGIRIMKACVREAYEKTRFGKANGELVRTQLKTLVIFAFMNPLTNAIMYIAVTVILLAGSFSVRNGSATPGNVMAALTYTTQLLNGILMLVMLFQNISRGITSWKRVKEVLESVPELKEGSFDGAARAQGEIEKLVAGMLAVVLSGTLCGILAPSLQSGAVDIIAGEKQGILSHMLILMLSVYLLYSICGLLQGLCSARLGQNVVRRMREELFGKIVELPVRYLDTHSHGDVMSRMTNDIENISTTVSQSLPSLFSGVLTVIGTMAVMLWYC